MSGGEDLSRSQILRVNTMGFPTHWLSKEEAALLYAKDRICWELGDQKTVMHGGHNSLGVQSVLELAPVISTYGVFSERQSQSVALTNRTLFKRDNHLCMYCGEAFDHRQLTRDHIVPRSKGGKNTWSNVVAACKRCNHAKGNKLVEDTSMNLLAVPFVPNMFEGMYLMGRNVLADQMDYLSKKFSGKRDWKNA